MMRRTKNIAVLWTLLAISGIGIGLYFAGGFPGSGTKYAPTEQPVGAARKLLIEPDIIDIGPIPVEEGIRTATFNITNQTDVEQKLKVVSKSCGCLELKCPQLLRPFSSEKIVFEVDPRRKPGKVSAVATFAFEGRDDQKRKAWSNTMRLCPSQQIRNSWLPTMYQPGKRSIVN